DLPRPHRSGLAPRRCRGRRRAGDRRLCAGRGCVAGDPLEALSVGGVSDPAPAALDPAFVADATVETRDVSVWFGQKVALSELSCSFGPGVTGLLGPNGAGKTTLMRAIVGLTAVNAGTVRVAGGNPRADRAVQRTVALVSEDE